MRPAIVAVAIALFLFFLVRGIQPPVLYLVLLIPIIILIYGFVTKDLPEEKYEDENDGGDAGPGLTGDEGKS